MTWKKTKVLRLLREGKNLATVKLMRPYSQRNYRVTGLPPGWQRMCKAVGVRPDSYSRNRAVDWLCLIGRGRRWRINASRMFDMSVPHADFDRWANSTARTFPLPKTKTELELYVRFAHR